MRRLTLVALLASLAASPAADAADPFTKLTDVRVAMDDGIVLTSDVYVPTAAEADGDNLYPCVVELTPYRKELRASEGSSYLPGQGVALIEIDARGTGGSGGEYDIVFSVREQRDAANFIEWAAAQATKDGKPLAPDASNKLCEETVGMYGGSYSGIIQYLVATLPAQAQGDVPAAPPHLAAIAPQRAYGDLYRDIVYHGGQLIGSFGVIWSTGTTGYYTAPPLDANTSDGSAAWLDHLTKNDPMMLTYISNQYADVRVSSDESPRPYSQRLYDDSSALPRIENLRVPTLHLAGFFDTFTRGQLLTFSRARALERALGGRGPNYLIVGPWNHSGTHFITPDQGYKQRLGDWYRYWLEGRASGAPEPSWFAEPRARYFQSVTGKVNAQSPADGEWKTADDWPPPGVTVKKLYLRHDGDLAASPDGNLNIRYYASNPSAGTGELLSRWDNAASGSVPHPQWDQRIETGKGLRYQTAPLGAPIRVAGPIGLKLVASVQGASAGSPVAEWPGVLQLTPPHLDTDFVVKLSDVGLDGTATLVTQGYLRASHRAYDLDRSVKLGGEILAPYHLHTFATLDPPTSGEPREYRIEIWPTAKTFETGHRIQLDVYSADTPGHLTLLNPTLNGVYHGLGMDSILSIPVLS